MSTSFSLPKRDRCRIVNDELHIREREKNLFRRMPVKRAHGEIVVFMLMNSQLFLEILERIKLMTGIKVLVVLAMTALNLTIMSRCERSDFLMPDAEFSQGFFKEGEGLLFAVSHPIGKLKTVVGLNTLDRIGELFYHMLEKLCGGVGTVLLKGLQIPESAVFIDERVLIPLCAFFLPDNTGLGNKFYIDLHTLAGVLHLFVWLRCILWVRQLDRLAVDSAQQLVQP